MGIKRRNVDVSDYLDEDADTKPAVTADDDDDEDVKAVTRKVKAKSTVSDDDDEPKSRKTKATADDDDDFEDEDEDERPARSSVVQAGWGAARKLKSEGGDFAAEFKWTDEADVVKFLGDEPFAVYRQHWVKEITEGKRSFICLGKGCPLCEDLGHQPDKKFAFSVAVLGEKGDVEVKALIVGPRLLNTLEQANDNKQGPLSRLYWALSRTGKGKDTAYSVTAVKPRDLEEDYEIDPADVERALKDVKPLTADVIRASTKGELRRVAEELA